MSSLEHYTAAELLQSSLEVALPRSTEPLVLAVSGGSDSMAMLFAMARWARPRVAAVATFDHGTGAYASEAAALVSAHARRLGFTVVRERSQKLGLTEADWRSARWDFLNRVAAGFNARVATAHTRDDQVETVVMRLLRGSGARGLAALAAPGPVVRPWLAVARSELRQWVKTERLPFLDDPMNDSFAFARVRIRLGLLPVLEAASPGFKESMLDIAARAASLRHEVDLFLDQAGLQVHPKDEYSGARAVIPAAVLAATTLEGRALLWQAICAKAGVTLDARGTRAAVRFTSTQRTGAYLELAGGAGIERASIHGQPVFVVRPASERRSLEKWVGSWDRLPSHFGRWKLKRIEQPSGGESLWEFGLPADVRVTVRPWRPGDRIRGPGAPAGRRVTRYFTESRIPVPDRKVWPVVVAENEVVWVPGVCRENAVPPRSGRPVQIWYRCERKFG